MFGLSDTTVPRYREEYPYRHYHPPDFDDDDDADDNDNASRRIRVHHLDTLKKAFVLLASASKCTTMRIMADEHHVVALSCRWLGIFDLQAIGKESKGGGGGGGGNIIKKWQNGALNSEREVN